MNLYKKIFTKIIIRKKKVKIGPSNVIFSTNLEHLDLKYSAYCLPQRDLFNDGSLIVINNVIVLYCIVLYCIVLYCIVLYCIMRPYTDGRLDRYRIGIPRELSEIRTQPWLSEGSLTCDPYHHRGPIF